MNIEVVILATPTQTVLHNLNWPFVRNTKQIRMQCVPVRRHAIMPKLFHRRINYEMVPQSRTRVAPGAGN
jgi:UDP:flavonoid glycosyltransferase YjiC (YdhE family)